MRPPHVHRPIWVSSCLGSIRMCAHPLVWGPTFSFYRTREGSANSDFPRKEPPGKGKTKNSARGEAMRARGPRGHLAISYSLWRTMWACGARAPYLGYDDPWPSEPMTRCGLSCCALPLVCALRSSPIGHEYAIGRGAYAINAPQSEGFIIHECTAPRGVRRSWVGGGPTPLPWLVARRS